jgi:hypothetical protein
MVENFFDNKISNGYKKLLGVCFGGAVLGYFLILKPIISIIKKIRKENGRYNQLGQEIDVFRKK